MQKTCLGAAMQISLDWGVEAGLTSVFQLLKKNSNSNRALFRDGAGVHFVFISDTHDPGFPAVHARQDYIQQRPKFANIAAEVKANSRNISRVKLHGVLPFSKCENNKLEGSIYEGSYLPEIAASGGVAVDMCSDSIDYRAVVNQILNEARKIPPFKLKGTGVKDVSVKLNNVDYKNFQVIDGHSVEINGLMENQNYTVEISYTREAM
jgi:hypothetical protein